VNVATLKWLGILLDVVAYELAHRRDGMLLSEQCHRWVRARPVAARLLIVGVAVVLGAHLGEVVPRRWDLMGKQFWGRVFGAAGMSAA